MEILKILSADLCTNFGSETLMMQLSDGSCLKQAVSLPQARLHNPQALQRCYTSGAGCRLTSMDLLLSMAAIKIPACC